MQNVRLIMDSRLGWYTKRFSQNPTVEQLFIEAKANLDKFLENNAVFSFRSAFKCLHNLFISAIVHLLSIKSIPRKW